MKTSTDWTAAPDAMAHAKALARAVSYNFTDIDGNIYFVNKYREIISFIPNDNPSLWIRIKRLIRPRPSFMNAEFDAFIKRRTS